MTYEEQDAFVEAYSDNVGDVHPTKVADFVERYTRGESIPYGEGHTSILDALGMWRDAVQWKIKQGQTS